MLKDVDRFKSTLGDVPLAEVSLDTSDLLHQVRTILVIDSLNKSVPEVLTRARFRIFVRGGPGLEDYSACKLNNSEIALRRTGRRPDRADLLYSFRPFAELTQTIETAKAVGAKSLWTQSGVSPGGNKDPRACWMAADKQRSAQQQAEAAGLQLITQPCIADVACEISSFVRRREGPE